MAIIRGTLPSDDFTIVPNAWRRDSRLGHKEKGLLFAIASHREDYHLTVAQLVGESSDGEAAVYAGLRQLVDLGYLRMTRRRGERGRLAETDFVLVPFPEPAAEEANAQVSTTPRKSRSGDSEPSSTTPRFPTSGESTSGKPTRGKSKTKKTTNLEDHVLEDQSSLGEDQKNPPLPPEDPPPAPPDASTQGGESESSSNPEPQNPDEAPAVGVLASVLADVPALRRPRGEGYARLVAAADDALLRGWSPTSLREVLSGSFAGAGSAGAVLGARMRDLGDPPAPEPQPEPQPEKPPCAVRGCDQGWIESGDVVAPCPTCRPRRARVAAA